MLVLDMIDLSLYTSLDKLVEQPEARVFDIPSPDILGDVLPSMIGTVASSSLKKIRREQRASQRSDVKTIHSIYPLLHLFLGQSRWWGLSKEDNGDLPGNMTPMSLI